MVIISGRVDVPNQQFVKCTGSSDCVFPARVLMHGYAESYGNIVLCEYHTKQLARKLLEDLCELAGDRFG